MNRVQMDIFEDIMSWCQMSEYDLCVSDIAEYCRKERVSSKDEMQIYIYLYGVHENEWYESNDIELRKYSRSMMDYLDKAVQVCDIGRNGPYQVTNVYPEIEPPQQAPTDVRV